MLEMEEESKGLGQYTVAQQESKAAGSAMWELSKDIKVIDNERDAVQSLLLLWR